MANAICSCSDNDDGSTRFRLTLGPSTHVDADTFVDDDGLALKYSHFSIAAGVVTTVSYRRAKNKHCFEIVQLDRTPNQ